MLARQRQLLKQNRQNKAAASRQLPSSGGTSANSLKATAQRTSTRAQQKVNQDVATLRALADNMRRNQERSNRQIKPDPSPRVRYTGPNGPNPKGQPSLPPARRSATGPIKLPNGTDPSQLRMKAKGLDILSEQGGAQNSRRARQTREAASRPQPQNGGALTQRGGALTQRGGGVTRTRNGGPVDPVRVRDMGNTPPRQLPGQRGLPGGTGGADSVRASGARTGQPGPNRPALPAGRPGGSLATRAKGAGGGGAAAAFIASLAEPAVSAAGQSMGKELGKALIPVGRRIDDMLPGVNSRDEANRRKRATPLRQTTAQERARAVRLEQYNPPAKPKAPKPSNSGTTPVRSTGGGQAEVRSSGRPSSASRQPTQTVRPPSAPSAPRAPKQEPKAQPNLNGVGPVKDGELYSDKLKISKVGSDGPDLERRRAFLDAKDSMSGMKAVKALLEKRKKRMAEG